jgi:hypothetical protein
MLYALNTLNARSKEFGLGSEFFPHTTPEDPPFDSSHERKRSSIERSLDLKESINNKSKAERSFRHHLLFF